MTSLKQMKTKWAQRQARSTVAALTLPKLTLPKLILPKGEPQRCFYNSMCAVWKHPDRLVYVEGFVIDRFDNDNAHFNHHAWVKDRVTGTQHELTIRDKGTPDFSTYTGIEFTKEQLLDPWEDPLESPAYWTPQLTIGQQQRLLQDAGYDVVLWKIHDEFECEMCSHERWDDCPAFSIAGWGEPLPFDPDTRNEDLHNTLNEVEYDKGNFEHPLWTYTWRTKESLREDAPNATVPSQEQAVEAEVQHDLS